jgi:hypothetical protein
VADHALGSWHRAQYLVGSSQCSQVELWSTCSLSYLFSVIKNKHIWLQKSLKTGANESETLLFLPPAASSEITCTTQVFLHFSKFLCPNSHVGDILWILDPCSLQSIYIRQYRIIDGDCPQQCSRLLFHFFTQQYWNTEVKHHMFSRVRHRSSHGAWLG